MKNMIFAVVTAVTLVAAQAFADEADVSVGFKSGAVAIGGSYAKMTGDMGWGGYLLFQSEKDDAYDSVLSTMALGAMWKFYAVKKSSFDIFAAPGFGLAMISDVPKNPGPGEDDKTVFGPSFKIGARYALNSKVKLGLEYFAINNWFDDEAPNSVEWTNVSIGFEF